MKHVTMLTMLTMVLLLAVGQTPAQTYSVEVTRTRVDTTLDLDFFIGNSSAPFVLGTSSFLVNYDTTVLTSPTKLTANDGPWDNTDGDYINLLLNTGPGYAGLTVEFNGSGNMNGANVGVPLTRIGTIRFMVLDSTLAPGLSWRSIGTNTQVFRLTNPGISTEQTEITDTNLFVPPDNTPLPITLASFTAALNTSGSGVRLEWTTLSEVNNYGFYVQRKAEGEPSFADLPGSYIPGNGTTATPKDYSFLDKTITTAGRYYYRLRQVDLDGTNHYLSAVGIDVLVTSVKELAPAEFALLQNYPNPFNPETVIKFSVEATGRATLRAYNIIGQEVATLFDGVAEAGQYYRVRVNGSNLASGVYFYRLDSGAKSDLRRMILLK